MTAPCIGTPISWLRLDQYLLGELPANAQREVQQHLDACPACRSCVEFARQAPAPREQASTRTVVRERREARPQRAPVLHRPRRAPLRRWSAIAFSVAALLGALVLMLRPGSKPPKTQSPAARTAIKGGELAIELVREREGIETSDPERVSPHDRVRIVITCPPAQTRWDAVIYQGGSVDFPLEGGAITCGNRVVLPGAFRMTATGPATICVVLDPWARSAMRRHRPNDLPAPRVCQQLEVVP